MKNESDHQQARLQTLWDTLADFPSSQMEAARRYLLEQMCLLLDADNAMWAGVVRLAALKHDPQDGWRMPVMRPLHPPPGIAETLRDYQQSYEDGPNEKSVHFHAQAGRFRVMMLADLVEPEWFESDYYKRFFRQGMNALDVMFVGAPVNADAEAGLAFYRAERHFTRNDCALAAEALRGLRWFYRLQLLHDGLLLANEPLTPTEQRMLRLALEGASNQEIATAMGHQLVTTNEYLGRLYRKFGVRSRSKLMALWLGAQK